MISPELLRRYQGFAPVAEESLKAVAQMAEEALVSVGTEIHREGEPANTLSLIVDGEVDIQYVLGTGERRTVDTLGPGDILGWPAMVEPYRITCFAIARRATRLIHIDAVKIRALCDRDATLGYRILGQIIKLLSERLETARIQIVTAA
jgi:CRP-like cAMP-binding protein